MPTTWTRALWTILLAATLLACGGAAVEEERSTGDGSEQDAPPREPIVCRPGAHDHQDASVRSCPEGLSCCYPCGVEGCAWVCASPERCEAWSTLPATRASPAQLR